MCRSVGLLLGLLTLAASRRPAAVALAALLALGAMVVVGPRAARADPIPEFPVLTIDPSCEPPPQNSDGDTITLTARGFSFEAGRTVMIYFNGSQVPGAEAVSVGAAGAFEIPLTVTELGNTPSYEIAAYYTDVGVTDTPVASAFLSVPCDVTLGSIRTTPDCGPPNTPIAMHVDLTGFLPRFPIQVQVVDLFSTDTIYGQAGPVEPVDPSAVSFDFSVTVPAIGAYRVMATQTDVASESFTPLKQATTGFVAPCSLATLSPTCNVAGSAPDRYPIQVTATGLLPGLPVGIIFDSVGQPQYFGGTGPVNQDGSFGPVEITPYARGPGTYDVELTQQNDSPILHYTHATFTVECPPPGNVSLNPPCAAPQFVGDEPRVFQLVVSAEAGFQPGLPVTATFDPDLASGPDFKPESGQATVDGNGGFSLTLNVAARPAGTYRVSVEQQVNGAVVQGIVPPFAVPCARPNAKIGAKPNCGDDVAINPNPYSITVNGRGFIPGFVQLLFNGQPQPGPVFANQNGRFGATISPGAVGPGAYTIVAMQADSRQTLDQPSAGFTVPCTATPQPMLTIDPPAVAPGFVVLVSGTGFPPGKQVQLTWSFGIGAARPIGVVAGADGTFERQVLIFAHDFAGARQLSAGTAANPNSFPDTTATLLVSAGQGSPPSYSVFGGSSLDQPPIIIRR